MKKMISTLTLKTFLVVFTLFSSSFLFAGPFFKGLFGRYDNGNGNTPLHDAILKENIEKARALVDNGADV